MVVIFDPIIYLRSEPKDVMRSRNLPKLQPGDLVAGRFRIIEPIGSGGFSVVYRAHQEELNRFIALKILKPQASNDEKIVERFRREALYASHLSHPNTITLYDYGHTEDNLCFIAMEYLKGTDLSAVVQMHQSIDLKRVWRVLVQCSRSLSEAHKLGLVHRDLKPENIFLVDAEGDQEEVVKVLDFGVSKAVSGFGDASTLAPLTQEGTVFGTPLYMAPEQAMAEGISPAVDVYALGHIMFEMITGYAAYDGLTNAMDVMLKQINDPPLALPDPWDRTPFSELITLCTQKDPEHRIQSASILLEHLLSEPFARWADPFERRRTITHTRISTEEVVITNHMVIEDLEEVYAKELDVLNLAFDEVTKGSPRLVLIHGTPGSGRSNLLRGFVDQRTRFTPRSTVLHRSFDSSLTVSGLEYELSLLSGELLQGRGINEVRRILKKLYGSQSEFEDANLGSESKPLDSLSTMRDSLFSQIGNPFREEAERQPIVWALENLERLDTLTLAFLECFLRDLHVNAVPILIVATIFSDDLQRRPGVAKYTEGLLKATPLSRHIFLRSDSEDQPVVEEEDDYAEPATIRLEISFEDMRTERIQTIADPESPFDVILGHLAQLGDEIPTELWKLTHARILETTLIGAVDTTLQQADKFGIISVANEVIRFTQSGYSEMLRDSFETLGGSKESHLKIAELLQQYYPQPSLDQVKLVAQQWELGGKPQIAVELLITSGDAAFRSLDLDAAREYFLNARQITGQHQYLKKSCPSSGICLRLGEVHWALGEHGPAEDALIQAIEDATQEDAEVVGNANKLLGALAYTHGKYVESLRYYEHARQSFVVANQTVGFTNATNEMGKCALAGGQSQLAETLCREALSLCSQNESLLLGRINRNLGMVLMFGARFSEAAEYLDMSIQIFEKSGRREELIEILNEAGNASYADSAFERAIGYFRRAITLATLGQQNHDSRIGAARVFAATRESEKAETILNTALTHATLVNDTTKMSEIHLLLGDLALTSQDVAAANLNYQTTIKLAEPIGLFKTVIRTRIRLAYTAFFSRNEALTFDSLSEAMTISQRVGNIDAELQIRGHLIYLQLLQHGFRERADTFLSLLNESVEEELYESCTISYIFKADNEAVRGLWRNALDYLQQARISAARINDYATFIHIERRAGLIRDAMNGTSSMKKTGCAIGALIPPEVGSRFFTAFPEAK